VKGDAVLFKEQYISPGASATVGRPHMKALAGEVGRTFELMLYKMNLRNSLSKDMIWSWRKRRDLI
jgi:hypothetical protein